MNAVLFQPFRLHDMNLANRIVLSPMTRSRAGAARLANQVMAEYYTQRAAATQDRTANARGKSVRMCTGHELVAALNRRSGLQGRKQLPIPIALHDAASIDRELARQFVGRNRSGLIRASMRLAAIAWRRVDQRSRKGLIRQNQYS
jgi:hypothetical protein